MEKNNKIIPKFGKNDYIINHASGDMAIVKDITKKGYYQFEVYYGDMFKQLKDVKDKSCDLQINYQKFYELCTEDEKRKLDEIIKKGGK